MIHLRFANLKAPFGAQRKPEMAGMHPASNLGPVGTYIYCFANVREAQSEILPEWLLF